MKSKALVPEANAQLRALATEIQDRYALCEQEWKTAAEHAQATLEHAQAIGEKLIAAKKLAGHGRWESWAKSNLRFSIDKAERLMRLHKNWGRVKSATEPILGIKGAIAYLTAEKKVKQDKLGAGNGEAAAKANERQSSPTGNGVVAEPSTETPKASSEQSVCSFCGFTEFDEDEDCVKCHEPRVWPRPKDRTKAEPAVDAEVDGESDGEDVVEDDDEPQSVRDCYIDPADADLLHPEEPLAEDACDELESMCDDMEQSLNDMLAHDAVAALSEHDPLRVSLIRLERAMTEVSAALDRKRPISLNALQVA